MIFKRGLILVVLLFFLLNIFLVLSLNINDANKRVSLGFVTDDDYGGCNVENIQIEYYDTALTSGPRQCYFDNSHFNEFFLDKTSACALNRIDYNKPGDNDCGGFLTSASVQVNAQHNKIQPLTGHGGYTDRADCKNYYTSGFAYLCSDDHFWHECKADKDDDSTVTWANNKLYNCTKDKLLQIPVWKEVSGGTDLDHDGVSSDKDCYDNPDEKGLTPKDQCPENSKDCNYKKDAKCAICIHPGAPEVCGDEVDNDCNEKTSDDCNKFKEGCEQTSIEPIGNEDKTAVAGPQNFNVKGDSFSFSTTKDGGGYCCGFNGEKDLGQTVTDKDGNNRVCLNDKEVGTYGKYTLKELFDNSGCKDGKKWCFVKADGNAKFQVLTVRQPNKVYDIVSNYDNWFKCDDGVTKLIPFELPDPNPDKDDPSLEKWANRFVCYKDGDKWSWAECVGPLVGSRNEVSGKKTIKARYAGDALVSLQLDNAKGEDGAVYSADAINLNMKSKDYENFYGKDQFDFTGYDYLEFMVKFVGNDKGESFTKLVLPASVQLKILGPNVKDDKGVEKPIVYFDQNILGYIVGGQSFSNDNWMHIKVPISDFKAIQNIKIKANEGNIIGIRNVYLSKKGELTKFCSGANSEQNIWLTNLDEVNGQVTGKDLCTNLYGKYAWLGDDVTNKDRRCCGNDVQEFYAGLSTPQGDKKDEYYGCWNSLLIKENNTVMDVEFSVGYNEKIINVEYPEQSTNIIIKSGQDYSWSYFAEKIKEDDAMKGSAELYENSIVKGFVKENVDKVEFSLGKPILVSNGDAYLDIINVDDRNADPKDLANITTILYLKNEVVYNSSGIIAIPGECGVKCSSGTTEIAEAISDKIGVVANAVINTFSNGGSGAASSTCTSICHVTLGTPELPVLADRIVLEVSNKKKINFYGLKLDAKKGEVIKEIKNQKLSLKESPLNVFSLPGIISISVEGDNPKISYDIKQDYDNTKIFLSTNEVLVKENKISKNEILKYSCTSDQCLYSLPWEAPYKITNLHPELYELYFVGKEGKEYLISQKEQKFEEFGNIKVKKLAQQVIYAGDETDKAFYGCQAASYLVGDNKVKSENNLDYCGFKGKYFCAPSVDKGTDKDKFTLINSWDKTTLTEAGYDKVDVAKGIDIKDVQLKLRTLQADKPADELFRLAPRNLSAVVLPARNFVPNAEFKIVGASVPNWEVFNADGTLKTGEATNKAVVDGKFTLIKGEILRSQKIVVGKNLELQFNVVSTCLAKLYLVDKDGKATEVQDKFNTGDNNYVQIEFNGECTLNKPMLQLVDELGAVKDYNYASEPDKIARAGMACCPDNSCWNGYACVEEMGPFAAQAEHISEGRDYRCIKGKWEYLPVKFDWNGEEWGFCSSANQCLVLRDDLGGFIQYKAEDFTSGKYPICIDDKKSILDHYCDKGNWTSRTKFIATKLLEVAETSVYVLYCSNYEDTLLELDNKEDRIQGKPDSNYEQEKGGLLGTEEKKPVKQICFDLIVGEGKRLVPERENTCINNVCVLKYKEGGKYKVAFATTLNKPISDDYSFLGALELPPESFASACKSNEQSKFLECDLTGLNVPGELWYNEELQGVIYGKDGIKLSVGILDKISNWFKDLFASEKLLSEETNVLQQGKNFKDIYALKIKDKKVQAIKEIEGLNKTLIAQYENFDTSICDYVQNYAPNENQPKEIGQELLPKASGEKKVACSKKDNIQTVQAKVGLDILWPQLTGKLRVEEK